jgi:hypothetical protein
MQFVLPSLAPTESVATSPFGVSRVPVGQWFVNSSYRLKSGFHLENHGRTVGELLKFCNGAPACYSAHGLQLVSFYQPASHYWILQWREAGLYVAATGVLLSLSIWSIRRWSA